MGNNTIESSKEEVKEEPEQELEAESRATKLRSGKTCLLHRKPLPCEDCKSGKDASCITQYGREKISSCQMLN